MKDPNVFPAEPLKKELNEEINKRTFVSKTYLIDEKKKKYKLMHSFGAVHYKENNEFKEIDLTLHEAEDYFYMSKSLYDLKIFKNFIGYQYESKEGGRVDVKLKEIDGVDISKLNLNINLQRVPKIDNRVIYREVLPGLDVFLNLRSAKSQLFKVIKNDSSPVKFAWDVYEDTETKAHFNKQTTGIDKNKNKIELTNQIEEIGIINESGRECKHFVFKEEFGGRIAIKDKETRIKSWSNEFVYPIVIDADVEEDIDFNVDDGNEKVPGTTWYSNISYFLVGNATATTFHGGFRFRTIGIPQGATIDDAKLKLTTTRVFFTPSIEIYGDNVDNAALWANGNLPSGITKTAASKTWSATATGVTSLSITSIVQEIVSRPGWSSGNDMRFAALNKDPANYNSVLVYDYKVGQANAAHLIVNYTSVIGPFPTHFRV